jgi:hypothetical protein
VTSLSDSGSLAAADVLTFGRDLERFRRELEWAACHMDGPGLHHQRCDRWQCSHAFGHVAAAFLALIDELQGGAGAVESLKAALATHAELEHDLVRVRAAEEARYLAEFGRRQADELVARLVECPECGMAAGAQCVNLGSGRARPNSHVRRLRLARREGGS